MIIKRECVRASRGSRPGTAGRDPGRMSRKRSRLRPLAIDHLEDRTLLNGALDPAFGAGGLAVVPFGEALGDVADMAIQPDGKIVVVGDMTFSPSGNRDFTVARYNQDGTLDPSFSGDGVASVAFDLGGGKNDRATGVAIQYATNAIVVVGTVDGAGGNTSDFGVAQFNPEGTLDTAFGTAGKQVIDFNLGGGSADQANDVVIQHNSKIIVAGSAEVGPMPGNVDFAVAQLNSDGSLDTNFGTGGKVTYGFTPNLADRATAVTVQDDSRIVLAGTVQRNDFFDVDFGVVRLRPDGQPDAPSSNAVIPFNFVANGVDVASDVAVQPDGKIVVAGTVERAGGNLDFGVVRLTSSLLLDLPFGTGGKQTVAFDLGGGDEDRGRALALQADGRIVVAGSAEVGPAGSASPDFAAARLTPDGALDGSFDGDGKRTVAFDLGPTSRRDSARAVAIQSDGRIVLAGAVDPGASLLNPPIGQQFALARLDTSGALDPSFDGDGRVSRPFSQTGVITADAAVQPDGKFIVVGQVDVGGGNLDFGVARLNLDGSLDPSFGGDGTVAISFDRGGDNADVPSVVALQADGKIVVVGTVRIGVGQTEVGIARLNVDGVLDPSFGGGSGKRTERFDPAAVSNEGTDVVVQPDGKLVVAGNISFIPGSWDFGLCRFLTDGTLDPGFGTGGRVRIAYYGGGNNSERAEALALQPDGRLVVAGSADTGAANTDFAVVRLKDDGTLDGTFNPGGFLPGHLTVAFDRGGDNRDLANDLALQPDGKIVVAGVAAGPAPGGGDFAVVRLGTTGALDPTFGTGGKQTVAFDQGGGNNDGANSLALRAGGVLIVGGNVERAGFGDFDFGVAYLNPDGSVGDTRVIAVNKGGLNTDLLAAVTTAADGAVVLAGTAFTDTPSPLLGGPAMVLAKLDSTRPSVLSLGPVEPDPRRTPVQTVDVTFSEPIDPATFDFSDITLTYGGNAVPLTNTVNVVPVSGAIYRIGGLAGFTSAMGTYTITVAGTGVRDPAGNAGTGGASDTFTVDLIGPTVLSVGPVAPDPRRTPVESVDVVLSEPVAPASFTVADLGLTRDGAAVPLGANVAVTPLGGATYRIGGLGSATALPGLYELTVDASGLSDPAGNPGTGANSAQFTVKAAAVPGDYDGDGQTDLALYHYDTAAGDAVFEIRLSNNGTPMAVTRTITGVGPHVVPVAGDFDGDGSADVAVVDPLANLSGGTAPDATVWIILLSGSGDMRREVPFGGPGVLDRPAPADYDGDGTTDIATFRANSDLVPGAAQWFILPSRPNPGGFATRDGAFPVLFGAPGGTDLPAPADYDGDGRADIATFRPVSDLHPGAADWFILPSGPNVPNYATTTGGVNVTFGAAGNADQPAVADYNGDGREDITAFRSESDLAPGSAQWFVLPSSGAWPGFGGGFPVTFGAAGEVAAVGDYTGDGGPDLALFDATAGTWRRRSGTSGPDLPSVTFGTTGTGVVPVLAPLFFRLRATGNI